MDFLSEIKKNISAWWEAYDYWNDLEIQYQGTSQRMEERSLAAEKMHAAAEKVIGAEHHTQTLELFMLLSQAVDHWENLARLWKQAVITKKFASSKLAPSASIETSTSNLPTVERYIVADYTEETEG